jgi:hypothetical protein
MTRRREQARCGLVIFATLALSCFGGIGRKAEAQEGSASTIPLGGPLAFTVGLQASHFAFSRDAGFLRKPDGGLGLDYYGRRAPELGLAYRLCQFGRNKPISDLAIAFSWTREQLLVLGEDQSGLTVEPEQSLASAAIDVYRVTVRAGSRPLRSLQVGVGLSSGWTKPRDVQLQSRLAEAVGLVGIDAPTRAMVGFEAYAQLNLGHSGLGMWGSCSLLGTWDGLMTLRMAPGSSYESGRLEYEPSVWRAGLVYTP